MEVVIQMQAAISVECGNSGGGITHDGFCIVQIDRPIGGRNKLEWADKKPGVFNSQSFKQAFTTYSGCISGMLCGSRRDRCKEISKGCDTPLLEQFL